MITLLCFKPYNNKKKPIVHNLLLMRENKQNTFNQLREKYTVFTYEDYNWEVRDNVLHFGYHFNLGNVYHFFPSYHIPLKNWSLENIDPTLLRNMIFNIGMVEMISYWKTACSPTIHIKPFKLKSGLKNWWRRLFYLGLGEFCHINGIKVDEKNLVTFTHEPLARSMPRKEKLIHSNGVMIPVGGGKDSLVSLGILSKYPGNTMAFAINPGKATLDSVKIAQLENSFFVVNRVLDPQLLNLNKKGFLNGHTPFSAIVAFVSVLAAAISGNGLIALSNESSANEPTIQGTDINHQYSKSFYFETDFRQYVIKNMTPDIHYFSLLRPLNELQIASIFSSNPAFFSVFRSCNVGSKTNSWCCNCPKCLFTFIMLAPFIDLKTLVEIFGENLLEKESLSTLLEQLAGLTDEKPFECIGTIDEVNSALGDLSDRYKENLPALLQHYQKLTPGIRFSSINDQLQYWNYFNNLQPIFEDLVKDSLEQASGVKISSR